MLLFPGPQARAPFNSSRRFNFGSFGRFVTLTHAARFESIAGTALAILIMAPVLAAELANLFSEDFGSACLRATSVTGLYDDIVIER